MRPRLVVSCVSCPYTEAVHYADTATEVVAAHEYSHPGHLADVIQVRR